MARRERGLWWPWLGLLFLLGLCSVASAAFTDLGHYRLDVYLVASNGESDSYDLTIYTAGPKRTGYVVYDLRAFNGCSAGYASVSAGGIGSVDAGEVCLSPHDANRFGGEDLLALLGTPIPIHLEAHAAGLETCALCSGFGSAGITLQFFEVAHPEFPEVPVPGDPVRILYAPPAALPEPSTWLLMASGLLPGVIRRFTGR